MTFLPIVHRELRIAARKRSTFWLRVAAAVVAMLLGTGFLVVVSVIPSSGRSMFSAGKVLFGILTWLTLICVFATGLFFTSDCISEEKREGTLGLLFLTDLRGYDVIAGKLLAHLVRGLFALFAVMPVLGITLLMGGVTGGQFTLTCLALVNALLYSLMAGMVISVFGRDASGVLNRTLLLLLGINLAGPGLDRVIAWAHMGFGTFPLFSSTSPGFVFTQAISQGNYFWRSLLATQISTWLFFLAACVFVPRVWHVRARDTGMAIQSEGAYRRKYGNPVRRCRMRQRLLEVNPVLWLTCRERWQAVTAWLLASVSGAVFILALQLPTAVWFVSSFLVGAVSLLLYLWVAVYSSRFLVDARRTGLAELLMVGPLSERSIVEGQWRGVVRLFAAPMLIIIAVVAGTHVMGQGMYRQIPASAGAEHFPVGLMMAASGVLSVIIMIGNLIALVWVGMWMGLTSRSANLATLKTLLVVEVAPWFVIYFGSTMIAGFVMFRGVLTSGGSRGWVFLFPLITLGVQAVVISGKNVFFIFWARKKLYGSFRAVLTQNYLPVYQPPPTLAVATLQPAPPPLELSTVSPPANHPAPVSPSRTTAR